MALVLRPAGITYQGTYCMYVCMYICMERTERLGYHAVNVCQTALPVCCC